MKRLSDWRPRGLVALALVVPLLCIAGRTSAADLGFYLLMDGAANSAHISRSDFHDSIADFLGIAPPATALLNEGMDTKTKSYTFTVGYQLGSYFAVEGSYIDFGKLHYDYGIAGQGLNGEPLHGRLKIKPRGPTVSAVGMLPLGPYFSLDAHAGFFFVDNKYDVFLENNGSVAFSDTKTAPYYGAGFAWWMTGQVALRVGYNKFHKAVFDEDASQYSIGVRYSYGY